MHVDLNPLVVAVAGLLVLLGPSIAGYINLQVRALALRVDAMERQAAADRATVVNRLDKLDNTVRSTASTTQEAVRKNTNGGGGTPSLN